MNEDGETDEARDIAKEKDLLEIKGVVDFNPLESAKL